VVPRGTDGGEAGGRPAVEDRPQYFQRASGRLQSSVERVGRDESRREVDDRRSLLTRTAQEVQVGRRMDGQDGFLVRRDCRDDQQRIAEGPDGRLRQALQPARMLGVSRIDMRRRRDDGEGDAGLGCDRRPPFLVERG